MATAHTEANKRWVAKNKAKANYTNGKSRSKSFITKEATLDDLDMILEWVEDRRKILKND